ncbi:MAG TPA: NADPH:quinone reductase [Actinophytocola sp.]|uniref:NADPH:quinone reductase n=1 Tax=Actinophytocola sp. TaxID=1872138 RepID=UPI002DBFA746|nr:NADPH:quinone reductase [Actinophytocola sp.]HEU5472417.1 NADPH:quinone reductase [Actinophytocola sp.]
MKAIVYARGGFDLVDLPVPEPGPGEVRVKVAVSGVNPTDWKARDRVAEPDGRTVPNQDGAGVVDAVGPDVSLTVGTRVWLWEAAWQRPDGTAQEFVVLPERHAVPLPERAAFDLGASIGIPALTAHRCLTVADGGPDRLAPGALSGRMVLVAGGAGAVGNAAIQLAKWAGATVVSTVSGPEKAELAKAAGADHVVNYRTGNAVEAIESFAPAGVDIVVEVSPATNAPLVAAVAGPNATVSVYATDGGDGATLPVFPLMAHNIRYQFVLVYTEPVAAKENAIADVTAAVAAGALRAGPEAGLPLHRFPLANTAEAHAAVRAGAVGKVLIDIPG